MINICHIVALLFAFGRLIELLGIDRISSGLRKRFPSYLWSCPRCLSVWAGLIATVLFCVFPWANWPLALSWLYIAWTETRSARSGRSLTVTVKDDRLEWKNQLTTQELTAFFQSISSPATPEIEVISEEKIEHVK